jgi:hypothetical protein
MNVAKRRRTIVWLVVVLLSPMMLTFTVEFTNDDGSLFVLGPCCGATEMEMSPKTQFVYTVKRVKDKFLV